MENSKQSVSTWYFVFGSPEKSSLASQYCRQSDYIHYLKPAIGTLKPQINKHALIQGSYQLFKQVQKIKPDLNVILVGKPLNNNQKQVCQQYEKIGRLKACTNYKYEQFRKKMYPNLLLLCGPNQNQNKQISQILSTNIGYNYQQFNKDPNFYISKLDKTKNYVIDGCFEDANSIKILSEFFQIRVIHLKYNRVDLPNSGAYFDKQFALVNFLKDKSYYIPINGKQQKAYIASQITQKLCPKLIYVNVNKSNNTKYLQNHIQQTKALLLNFSLIQTVTKRKKLGNPQSLQQKIRLLSSILYKDLNIKQIFITQFPNNLNQVLQVQRLNRKFSLFIDLADNSKYQFSKQFTPSMYFLENQKYIVPNLNNSLKNQLVPKVQYWIVAGPAGSGKTSVAKYLSAQYGYKLIQFQPYIQSVKQKLSPNEEGVVPTKNIIQHFRQLLNNDGNTTYIIDGFPYANKELEDWINALGNPNVINLQVQVSEQIKRSRKKAEADLAAQVTEQQSNKAKQSAQKNRQWMQKLLEYSPLTNICRIDYNRPQIQIEDELKSLLKPRIYLVQKNNTFVFQNIAVKYSLGFVNLNKVRLRQIIKQVKQSKKRDVILCNHGHQKTRIASQDLYWIEKNLGQIKYVGVWLNQSKQNQEQLLKLQRPPQPEKPKPAQGQQKPPQDPPAEGGEQAAKKLDIYDYQWTKPGDYKNLSQWFYKSKHNITQFQSSPEECFNKFKRVLDMLNQNSENNIYQRIKRAN